MYDSYRSPKWIVNLINDKDLEHWFIVRRANKILEYFQ
eukprot:UN11833